MHPNVYYSTPTDGRISDPPSATQLRKRADDMEHAERRRAKELKAKAKQEKRRAKAHAAALAALLDVAKNSTDDEARVLAAVEILHR